MLTSEYYRRTTWKERLFNRIAFAYRQEQRQEAEDQDREKQERQAAMQQQMAQYHAGRP